MEMEKLKIMNKQILITAVERLVAGIAGVEKQIKHRKQCGENGCRLTELYDYYCVNRDRIASG